MNLPAEFIANINNSFGERGRRYLETLPDLLAEASRRWDLTLGKPFLLSYNYVCAAKRADGTPAVLKVGVPNNELTSEINTLRLYAGKGACHLYESDPEIGMLLLERLHPGSMLTTLADDDEATRIAADLLIITQRPAPAEDGFLSLRGWFDELKELRPAFGGGTGPFPEKIVTMVEDLLPGLFAEARSSVLLHGDFHHFNILLSERGWLVIDPKGVVGAPEYEVGPFLVNPMGASISERQAIQRTRRRIAILAERTGLDPQCMHAWAICFSLLSAWWDTQENGAGGEYSLAWTRIFSKTRV